MTTMTYLLWSDLKVVEAKMQQSGWITVWGIVSEKFEAILPLENQRKGYFGSYTLQNCESFVVVLIGEETCIIEKEWTLLATLFHPRPYDRNEITCIYISGPRSEE